MGWQVVPGATTGKARLATVDSLTGGSAGRVKRLTARQVSDAV